MQFVICFVSSPGVAIAALTRERSPGSTDTELEWALAGLAVVAPKISLTDMTNDLHQKCLDSVFFDVLAQKGRRPFVRIPGLQKSREQLQAYSFQGCNAISIQPKLDPYLY